MGYLIAIVLTLILYLIALYIAFNQFKKNEYLEGLKYTFLSLALFIVFCFLCTEISFDFPNILDFLFTTIVATKALSLATRFFINISRVNKEDKEDKKTEYYSSITPNIIIFFTVAIIYFFTKDYELVTPKTFVFLQALSYPLLGATLTQWYQWKKLQTENELNKTYSEQE